MRAGEEMSTWKIQFGYESHKNVKDLRTMVRAVIDAVKDSTREARLSHTENNPQKQTQDMMPGSPMANIGNKQQSVKM